MKKIIDRNGRLFGFISVIDLLVIVVVAVMGFALYTKNTQMAITSTNTADQTITYQILASGIRTYVAEAVREGDQLFDPDRSSGGTLGTITDIQLMPGTKLAEFDDGTVAAATVPSSNSASLVPGMSWMSVMVPRVPPLLRSGSKSWSPSRTASAT